MTLIFVACATWVARFYKEAILVPLTMLISLNFFIGSLATVHTKLLEKQLNFKYLAVANTVSLCFSGTAAIIMAFLGFGVWSLAFRPIISTVSRVSLLWYVSDWRPKFLFDWKAMRE